MLPLLRLRSGPHAYAPAPALPLPLPRLRPRFRTHAPSPAATLPLPRLGARSIAYAPAPKPTLSISRLRSRSLAYAPVPLLCSRSSAYAPTPAPTLQLPRLRSRSSAYAPVPTPTLSISRLHARIKSQVKQELEVLLSEENLLSINLKRNKDAKYNDSNDHRLLTTLQSEVDFLRNEILTKNKIIEMILVDNRNNNVINENHSKHLNGDDRNHDTRKKSIRRKKRDQINSNTIQLNNRFSLLDDETNLRINDGNINTSQSTPINVECSMEKHNANDVNQNNHQDGNRERKYYYIRGFNTQRHKALQNARSYEIKR